MQTICTRKHTNTTKTQKTHTHMHTLTHTHPSVLDPSICGSCAFQKPIANAAKMHVCVCQTVAPHGWLKVPQPARVCRQDARSSMRVCMQKGWRVKQTNTCPNCRSAVAGLHSHGHQPTVAATGHGCHTVMEHCVSQEHMQQKQCLGCMHLSDVTQTHMQHGLAMIFQASRMSTKKTHGESDNAVVEPVHTHTSTHPHPRTHTQRHTHTHTTHTHTKAHYKRTHIPNAHRQMPHCANMHDTHTYANIYTHKYAHT